MVFSVFSVGKGDVLGARPISKIAGEGPQGESGNHFRIPGIPTGALELNCPFVLTHNHADVRIMILLLSEDHLTAPFLKKRVSPGRIMSSKALEMTFVSVDSG